MPGFGNAPVLVKVFLILLIVALVLHVVGFAAPYWQRYLGYRRINIYGRRERVDVNNGLWRYCVDGICHKAYAEGWFEAVQAFEVIGLIAGFVGALIVILYVFVNKTAGNRTLYIVGLIAVCVAAGATILGIIIYGAKQTELSWAYALTVIAGIGYGVAGVLMIINFLQK